MLLPWLLKGLGSLPDGREQSCSSDLVFGGEVTSWNTDSSSLSPVLPSGFRESAGGRERSVCGNRERACKRTFSPERH